MTIGSLFSGIGGLELGLEWAGLGPVLWQVEIDPKCRNCLATHWPEAERFEDVCKVGRQELKPVDIICGGFPCQDVSSAGKRAGLSGARSGLWFEMARVIEELRPRWVVIENVASGGRKWVDAIRVELERLGYGSLPVPLSAADCGAWHERNRVFIVAHAGLELKHQSLHEEQPINARRHSRQVSFGGSATAPDSDAELLRIEQGRECRPNRLRPSQPELHCGWETEPDVVRVVHGLPRGLDEPNKRSHRARMGRARVAQEKALGNSVVPQCGEVVGWVIRELMENKKD